MKQSEKYILAAAAVLALLVIPAIASAQSLSMNPAELIASFEGFSSTPYWDVSRYSWGYGTPAPGASGSITREQAMAELQGHSQADFEYLQPMITRPLTNNQWAALLSFAYNEGPGNADNLVTNINSGDDGALEVQWKKYIYADHVANSNLVARRAKEWQYWIS